MISKKILLVISLGITFCLFGCSKEADRDILIKCIGTTTTTDSSDPKNPALNKTTANLSSSIYIGKKEVQVDNEKFNICQDLKTQIDFADDCKSPKRKGSYFFALNQLHTNNISPNYPSLIFDYWGQCQTIQQSAEDEKKSKALEAEQTAALSKIELPEQCILNATKGGSPNYQNAYSIKENCNKLYAKQVEQFSQSLPLNIFSNVTLGFNQGGSIENPKPYLQVKLKNNSNYKIIYGYIFVTNNVTKVSEYYKVYADSPISPFAVGTLSAVIDSAATDNFNPNFWKTHEWGFQSMFGLTAP
jgi:hypothetical protein